MTLDELRRRHAATLERVNALIRAELQSDAAQVEDLRLAVERGRGKQIRPLLVAEISAAFGRSQDAALIGAVAEAIHCSSLVHDDIIDRCVLRRGQATMNALHGDAGALLLGDLLFTAVFSLAARQGEAWLCAEAAKTIKILCEGELLQQACRGRIATPISRYEEVIRRKTAALLEFAAFAAGRSAGASLKAQQELRAFASSLGIIFQIADDIADFRKAGQADEKDRGVDAANGFLTLPWLFLLQKADAGERAWLSAALSSGRPLGLGDPQVAALAEKHELDRLLFAAISPHQNRAEAALRVLNANIDTAGLQSFLKATLSAL